MQHQNDSNKNESYKITIVAAEEANINVIRTIMEITKTTAVEAKSMLGELPIVLDTVNSKEEATELRQKLESNGISVKIESKCNKVEENIAIDEKEYFVSQQEPIKVSEEINQEQKNKSTFRKFCSFILTLGSIALACFLIFGDTETIMTDILATINEDDNQYIQMVCDLAPFDGGSTYYEAFEETFDYNEWKYFKTDNGQRIVQVTSRYSDLDDELITQFILTPTDEKGYFLIEPYAMRASGQDLSSYEMNIVIAALFEGDITSALAELFFYGNLLW